MILLGREMNKILKLSQVGHTTNHAESIYIKRGVYISLTWRGSNSEKEFLELESLKFLKREEVK